MSNWSLDFNLRARTVRHSGNRKDIKMEGSRSKEGKSELIISFTKIHTAKRDLPGQNIPGRKPLNVDGTF